MTGAERDCRASHSRATRFADMAAVEPWYHGLAADGYTCAAAHADRIVSESNDPAVVSRYTRNAAYWRERAQAHEAAHQAQRHG
jgi:hypothetical protein